MSRTAYHGKASFQKTRRSLFVLGPIEPRHTFIAHSGTIED